MGLKLIRVVQATSSFMRCFSYNRFDSFAWLGWTWLHRLAWNGNHKTVGKEDWRKVSCACSFFQFSFFSSNAGGVSGLLTQGHTNMRLHGNTIEAELIRCGSINFVCVTLFCIFIFSAFRLIGELWCDYSLSVVGAPISPSNAIAKWRTRLMRVVATIQE